MSAHIAWLAAAETSVQVFTPGEDWVGAGQHPRPVLTLAQDDVIAFQGTPAELRALPRGSPPSPPPHPRGSTSLPRPGERGPSTRRPNAALRPLRAALASDQLPVRGHRPRPPGRPPLVRIECEHYARLDSMCWSTSDGRHLIANDCAQHTPAGAGVQAALW